MKGVAADYNCLTFLNQSQNNKVVGAAVRRMGQRLRRVKTSGGAPCQVAVAHRGQRKAYNGPVIGTMKNFEIFWE